MILINTRPVWNLGRNIWNQELRRNLNPGITLLSAPSQEISLYGERKICTLLMKRQIQFLLSCEVKKKRLFFLQVLLVLKHFLRFLKKRVFSLVAMIVCKQKRAGRKNPESFFLQQRNKITFGAIGEGTARRFCELFVGPLNKREYLKRDNLKMLYVEREATGQRWVEEFSEKIRSSFVAVMEGKENSVVFSAKHQVI